MNAAIKNVQVIVTDDDKEDYTILKSAFETAGLNNELIWVKNGEELIELLQRRGAYANSPKSRGPRLILLDLNMPRMDGREALRLIKADPLLRRIPIIIMTTSCSQDDVIRSYDQGASSFICKPVTFDEIVRTAGALKQFWLDLAELPNLGGAA